MAKRRLKKTKEGWEKTKDFGCLWSRWCWQTLAENSGVSKSMVYRWVSTEDTPDKRDSSGREKNFRGTAQFSCRRNWE